LGFVKPQAREPGPVCAVFTTLPASGLFWLLRPLTLAQAHAGAAAVLVDEFNGTSTCLTINIWVRFAKIAV
jgi:hypothetical protein